MFGFLWGFVNKNDKSNISKWGEGNQNMKDKRRLFLRCCISLIALIVAIGLLLTVNNIRKNTLPKAEMIVENAQDVIIQLANEESEYGYINALSELTEKSTSIVDGDKYYRLQQNYHGIPVYGRTVVCVANEDGAVTSITGNVCDIKSEIDMTTCINEQEALESIKGYIDNTLKKEYETLSILTLTDDLLVIYVTEMEQAVLVYEVTVIIDGEIYEAIIDAQNAFVYEVYSQMMTSIVTKEHKLEENGKLLMLF